MIKKDMVERLNTFFALAVILEQDSYTSKTIVLLAGLVKI